MKPTQKNQILNIALGVLAAGAVVMVGLRSREWYVASQSIDPTKPVRIAAWRQIGASGERMGPKAAQVTVVMFGDFECPFCRSASMDLDRIKAQQPQSVAIVFRHYPLSFHPQSTGAARAAVCAARQVGFEPIYHLLFKEQDSLGKKPWSRFASEAGVRDSASFSQCLTDPSVDAIIRKDSIVGSHLKIPGTPAILVNDELFFGTPGYEVLRQYVAKAKG